MLAAQIQYWLLAVIVLCSLGFFCYAFVKANTTQEKKVSEMVMGLGLCGALCCLVSARLPALLWVQWDEVQLLRTSAAMHFHRFNGYLEQALPGGSRLLPEVYAQDKRPPLFPFLLSLLHDLLGVRVANAFLLNIVVLFLVVSLAFLTIRRYFGVIPAIAAPFFLLSSPIALWCARSGSFDLLSLFLLGGMLVAAQAFIERPSSLSLGVFIFVGNLFSYARYESILVFALIVVTSYILLIKMRKFEFRFLVPIFFLPVSLAPLFLFAFRKTGYQAVYGGIHDFYGADPFSPSYVQHHAKIFFLQFFDLSSHAIFSGALNLVGVVCVGFYFLIKKRARAWDVLCFSGIMFPLFLMFSYKGYDALDGSALRLFLPIVALGSMAPLCLLRVFPGKRLQYVLLAGSVGFFFLRLPIAVAERGRTFSLSTREGLGLEELYQRGFPGKANSLIVTDVQGYFLMRAAAAVSPSYLHDHVSEVRRGLSEGLIGDVFLVDVFPESIHSPTGDLARALRAPLIDRVGFGGAEIRIFLLPK